MTSENTKESDAQSLCDFLGLQNDAESIVESITESIEKSDEKQADKPDDNQNDDVQTITVKKGTNYWLSKQAKEKRKAYHRDYYHRKKNEQQELIESLKAKQIIGATVTILNLSGKTAVRKITTEQNYLKLCDDLLATLQANRIINDYSIDSE